MATITEDSANPQPPPPAPAAAPAPAPAPPQLQSQQQSSSTPQYPEMIMAAIEALNEKEGSNKTSISKQIESTHPDLPPAHSTLLSHHLNKMKQSKKWLDEVRDQCAKATPFDLLAALFWTRVAHLKAPKKDNKHSLSICLDFRRLVQPPIPLGYFGNALHFSLLTLDEEEMDYGRLGHVVELVHRHVSDVGEEEVWSVVDWFESQKEEGGKYAQPFTMYGPELTCVSMEHMIIGHKSLMFSASFKSDEKPVHVACHVGNVRGEGLIVVLPSVEEGLARTVMVTLPEEEMPKLCEDQAIQCLQPTLLIGGRY